jgi:hypothetical protein
VSRDLSLRASNAVSCIQNIHASESEVEESRLKGMPSPPIAKPTDRGCDEEGGRTGAVSGPSSRLAVRIGA